MSRIFLILCLAVAILSGKSAKSRRGPKRGGQNGRDIQQNPENNEQNLQPDIPKITIIVNKISGDSIKFSTVREKTIEWVKARIFKDWGLPILSQRLILPDGSVRNDSETFGEICQHSLEFEFSLVVSIEQVKQHLLLEENANNRLSALADLVSLVELGYVEKVEVLENIVACLQDSDDKIRVSASDVISDFWKGDASAVRLVNAVMNDRALLPLGTSRSIATRIQVVKCLAEIGKGVPGIVDMVLGFLNDPSQSVQNEVLAALARVSDPGDERVVNRILPFTLVPYFWGRAAESLGELSNKGNTQVQERLQYVLFNKDSTFEDRKMALVALKDVSKVGDESTIECLLELINNDLTRPWSLSHEAIWSLARIVNPGDIRARNTFEKVINSRVGELDNGRERQLTHLGKAAKDALKCWHQRSQ